ncbi:MAG: DUF1543 domain-containing protein [Ginsengibacter sp.]
MKLFMLLLGATPKGRHTEQHDIFFGIAETLKDLVPAIIEAWPEAKGNIHIDAWREVNYLDQYAVQVFNKQQIPENAADKKIKLFFLNLGGYKQNEFEEFHYKMLVACENKSIAIQRAKATAFYKHIGFKGASSHIDDKYGVDVDDIFEIEDILQQNIKEKYSILLSPVTHEIEDEINLGYFRLEKL